MVEVFLCLCFIDWLECVYEFFGDVSVFIDMFFNNVDFGWCGKQGCMFFGGGLFGQV